MGKTKYTTTLTTNRRIVHFEVNVKEHTFVFLVNLVSLFKTEAAIQKLYFIVSDDQLFIERPGSLKCELLVVSLQMYMWPALALKILRTDYRG